MVILKGVPDLYVVLVHYCGGGYDDDDVDNAVAAAASSVNL